MGRGRFLFFGRRRCLDCGKRRVKAETCVKACAGAAAAVAGSLWGISAPIRLSSAESPLAPAMFLPSASACCFFTNGSVGTGRLRPNSPRPDLLTIKTENGDEPPWRKPLGHTDGELCQTPVCFPPEEMVSFESFL